MLAHPALDSLFCFDKSYVSTLVIEEPAFFRQFLRDIYSQTEGYEGQSVLSEHDTVIPLYGNTELIDDILHFQINRKNLLTKIVSWLERQAVGESYFLRTGELLSAAEQLISDLSFDLPCDTVCSKISIGSFLKSVGIEIADDYPNDLERFLDYMELVRQFDKNRLFVFVNLRSYYSDNELSSFFSSIVSHEYRVFLVDSTAGMILPSEKRVTVDSDLCEF